MTMTDETLSAFLDHALSDDEMAQVRQAIAQDPALAQRVEAFAMVDAQLRDTYSAIDQTPLPDAVQKMLKQMSQSSADNVVPKVGKVEQLEVAANDSVAPARWWELPRRVQGIAAAAAVFAIGFGFAVGGGQFGGSGSVDGAIAYQQALSSALSGQPLALTGGQNLTVKLTFAHNDGRVCRYYTTNDYDSVACMSGGLWQLEARQPAMSVNNGEYQAASGLGGLEAVLDNMIAGDILTIEQEQALQRKGWLSR